MCLDISYYSTLELLDDYFPDLIHDQEIEFDTDLNIHVLAMGYKRYPVILSTNGQYHRNFFEWCIIASYMDTPEKIRMQRAKMANARSEKIMDKSSWWHRIRKNRCLVPVTGIYEHRAIPGWKNKVPYYIHQAGRTIYFLPALYYYNPNVPSNIETGEVTGMFAIVTRQANSLMKQIHNDGDNKWRMPLFLTEQLEKEWLNQDLTDVRLAEILSFEVAPESLVATPVWSIRTAKSRPDGKLKNEIFSWPNLPGL
ncbi:MAG TPA: SOS response-associated peptidase family protein [Puia sp.]|nr:SOS response-associated peptidase family protein [Puia sp.]